MGYRWAQQLCCVSLVHLHSVAKRIGEREGRDKHRLTKQHLRVWSRKTGTKWAFALPLYKHALRTVLVEAVIERGGAKPLGNRCQR